MILKNVSFADICYRSTLTLTFILCCGTGHSVADSKKTELFEPVPFSAQDGVDDEAYVDELFEAWRTRSRIKIDGKLAEKDWAHGKAIDGFLLIHGRGKPQAKTEAKILYDDRYLYIGAKLDEPFPQKIRAAWKQHDQDIWTDDCLEICLDTGGTPQTYYHFIVNSIGGIWDKKGNSSSFDSRDTLSAGKKYKDFWTIEVAIPLKDLLSNVPLPGQEWGLRISRERKAQYENSSRPMLPPGFRFSSRYALGRLRFRGDIDRYSALELSIESSEFGVGINSYKVNVLNSAQKERAVSLVAIGILPKGQIVPLAKQDVRLQAGEKKTLFPPAGWKKP